MIYIHNTVLSVFHGGHAWTFSGYGHVNSSPYLPIFLPLTWRWCSRWCRSAACRRWTGGRPCRSVRCCFNDSYYIHNTRTQFYPYFPIPISLSPYLRPDDDVQDGVDLLHAVGELEDDHVGQWGAVLMTAITSTILEPSFIPISLSLSPYLPTSGLTMMFKMV